MRSRDTGGFHWDKHNAGHIARHKIRPEEVEQVLLNSPFLVGEDDHNGEERVLEIGHTEAGRVLFICWTLRDGRIRPVTAWPANRQEEKEYYEWKGMKA